MKRLILLLLIIPLSAVATLNSTAIQPIVGTWKVTASLPAAEFPSSPQEIQKSLGQVLTISTQGIGFEDLGIADCVYQNTRIITRDVEQYFQNPSTYQADASTLPLSAPITEISTSCDAIFYDKNVNQYIVFEWGGDFFKAVRVSQ